MQAGTLTLLLIFIILAPKIIPGTQLMLNQNLLSEWMKEYINEYIKPYKIASVFTSQVLDWDCSAPQ